MAGEEIFQVFYAPHKAFKKLVQDPRFLGPIIVLILFVALQVGYFTLYGSRSYLEQTTPSAQQGDAWTGNSTLWQASSGVSITTNYADYINSTTLYYNTSTIEFTANNATRAQIFLRDFGQSVNCSSDGFTKLSIRVKQVTPTSIPNNVTLYLYSLSPSDYFAYDLTPSFSNVTIAEQHFWNNITVQLNTNEWKNSNSTANWKTITGLSIDFVWSNNSNIDLRVAGLFFRGIYAQLLELNSTGYLVQAALSSATPFLFEWLLLTGLIYLLVKGLRGNVVWKPLMVAVGAALVTLVVQSIIIIVVNAAIRPNIDYPLEIIAGIPGEADAIGAQIVQNYPGIDQVFIIQTWVPIAVWIWIFVLDTFIVRDVTSITYASPIDMTKPETPQPEGENMQMGFQQFAWTKSMLVSAVSLVIMIIVMGFLGLGIVYG